MQNDLAKNTRRIESSVSFTDFTLSGSYLDGFLSVSLVLNYIVAISVEE